MATFEIEIRKAVTPNEVLGYRAVRERVFVEEQCVPTEEEYDDLDVVALHAIAVVDDVVVGTARLLPAENGAARIGRMAVDRPWRRQGIGSTLLRFLENEAQIQGYTGVLLHAQLVAADFYARYGYAPEGDVFLEANIQHVTMRKEFRH